MRLSLNDWPPLASHLSVFILGLIFANIFSPDKTLPIPLEIGQSYLRLKGDIYALSATELKINDALYWVSHEQDGAKTKCLAPLSPVRIAQMHPFMVIKLSIKEFKLLAIWSVTKHELKLMPPKEVAQMRSCYVETKISYGS